MNPHPEHDHERTDVPVWTIGKFMLGLAIGGVLVVIVLAGLWRLFAAIDEPSLSPWQGVRELPPGPRLQPAPVLERVHYETSEMERLSQYGVDTSTGVVRIPIERAMELIVQRGLPVRKQPAQAPNTTSGSTVNEAKTQ